MNRFLLISCTTTLAAIGAAVAVAQPVADGGRPLQTSLSGPAEVPGPGDTDGGGTFEATANPGQERICYKLAVTNIVTATAAHIHRAPFGVAGPVVVPLVPPSDGDSEACASVSRELTLEILKNPENFYVNVHNSVFPGGAIRGQLAKR